MVEFFCRDLRSKTTIAATNKVKNKEYLNSLLFVPGKYIIGYLVLINIVIIF